MPLSSTHLFVDISAHGLGHLAQCAPILNLLQTRHPELKITLRSGLPIEKLRARLVGEFEHLPARSDFGFVMIDAVRIDAQNTAAKYRAQHANWQERIDEEARFLERLRPDLVLSDVAYLPLAGAAQAKIPSISMCSLNWADLFVHFFGKEPWAAKIHAEILAAYLQAKFFLRLTPAMPMLDFTNARAISPVAMCGQNCRTALRQRLGCSAEQKLVLIAFGGFATDLGAKTWTETSAIQWLVPESWGIKRKDMHAIESTGFSFSDMLCSVDAVLTKPGYGTFTEAACNGTPILYVLRDDWPEQDCLIDWLKNHGKSLEISETNLKTGKASEALERLWQLPVCPIPEAKGANEVVDILVEELLRPSLLKNKH